MLQVEYVKKVPLSIKMMSSHRPRFHAQLFFRQNNEGWIRNFPGSSNSKNPNILSKSAICGEIWGQIIQTYTRSLRLNICATPAVDMPNCIAVSVNDTPYSLISFKAIALLSFGKGERWLTDWSIAIAPFSLSRVCERHTHKTLGICLRIRICFRSIFTSYASISTPSLTTRRKAFP